MAKIRTVIFSKNQKPSISIIEDDYELLEEIVGGNLEISKIFGDICIIHNEKHDYRAMLSHNFVVAGVNSNNELISLTDSQVQYVFTSVASAKTQRAMGIN